MYVNFRTNKNKKIIEKAICQLLKTKTFKLVKQQKRERRLIRANGQSASVAVAGNWIN
jgi:hypothetical protein